MAWLLARRLAQGVVIVWLVASLTFALLHLAPGDPVRATLDNPMIAQSVRELWYRKLCLQGTLASQYGCYLRAAAHGDFGFSLAQMRPVRDILADALPNTLLLMALALVVSFAAGIALGVLQASRRGTAVDYGTSAASLFFYSMPDFWLALMMSLVFAYRLHWLPSAGIEDPVLHPYLSPAGRVLDRARHLVLPVLTLALLTAAAVARYQRAAVLDVTTQDFVRTARAKGLGGRGVLLRHVLRNALLPVITLAGLTLPALIGGAVFVEAVFAWPGIGGAAVSGVARRDYPLVTAIVVLASALVVIGNILADLLHAAADPRVRAA